MTLTPRYVPVCHSNESASSLTCVTTEGPLLWIRSDSLSHLFNKIQDPVTLEDLNLSVVSVSENTGGSLSVTSTATIVDNFQFLSSTSTNLTVQCREITTDITKQSTFVKAGK